MAFHEVHRTLSELFRTTSRDKTENRIHKFNQRQKVLPFRLDNIERFSTTETNTDICGPERKREVTNHLIMARKRKIPSCASHKSPKTKSVKPVSENFQYSCTLFEEQNLKKIIGREL